MKPLNESYRNVSNILRILNNYRIESQEEITNITYFPCDYKKGTVLPDLKEFLPFTKGMRWGDKPDSHAWFHFTVTPKKEVGKGEITLKVRTEISGWDAVNPQFIAYVNGRIKQGLDTNHTTLTLSGADFYEVYLYGYVGTVNKNLLLLVDVIYENHDVTKLYYDLHVPYQILSYKVENSYEYQLILSRLDMALKKLYLLEVPSEKFYNSVKEADTYFQNEFYKKFCHKQDTSAICIGHTHIDIAWMWTIEQTREKAQRSFATVIELMKKYPEYKFMSSQAILYKMVKEECPELYQEIKNMIKAGRWEVEGAMWIEADCNISGGESLVRQVQYGKNFFRDEFGTESKVLWLPDVFGYAAALPQILRKSDVDWFVTSKISWNDTNMMPYDTFKWKGIDGTEINTHFLSAQSEKKGSVPERFTSYIPSTNPPDADGSFNRYQQKSLSNESIISFGFGDGGGGPTQEMLEVERRTEKGIPGCVQTKIDFAGNFLKNLSKKMESNPDNVPSWAGELYLEFHRGTYTSQARNKKNNRLCEFLILDTEFLYSMLEKAGLAKYPKEELHAMWETILTNQFHDIIPGSSIPEVYERTDKEYKEIIEKLTAYRNNAFDIIASKVDNKGYVVFNPHSFVNSSTVSVNGKSVYVKDVPAKGYKVIYSTDVKNTVKISGKTVITKFFAVKFDSNYNIVGIYDYKNHREVLKKGATANQLLVFEDYPDQYDAWELQRSSNDKAYPINDLRDVTVIDDGARTGLKITRNHLHSTVEQIIWFYEDMPKIDFETKLDWHEKHQILKVSFPVDINANRASYEIQFGTIERPTHYNTSWDQAKFEVCGHKYADLSEGNYGISILNNCKYGYDIHNSDIRLTLLKCALNPDNNADHINDQGVHTFTYSIYPHAQTLAEADTVKYAYDLNLPMTAVKAKGNSELSDSYSFVKLNKDNVILETVKKAEYSDETVFRMYECKNEHSRVKVSFGFDVGEVYLGNISEKKVKKLSVNNNSVYVDVNPFEIVTLLVK